MTSRYNVYLVEDGHDETYIGTTTSLRAARRIAAQHGRGERPDLPASLYETARAAGHVCGLTAPDQTGEAAEPCEWTGRGGNYAIVPVLFLASQ